jgi:hypothetical protein
LDSPRANWASRMSVSAHAELNVRRKLPLIVSSPLA